ncbi:MAG: glycosyltransferase family 39 protein [Armatimonadetes bacterium]|nr:MAG: glycosyltransferase family 39 protein [Armatimonadota bacterium]
MTSPTSGERAVSAENYRHRLWLFAYLIAILPLSGFWLYGLMDIDEGLYASVIRTMLATGDWMIPRIEGEVWMEKPVLVYWLNAPFIALLGDTFGPRLGSVLCSIGTLVLCAEYVAKRFSDAAGRWTLVVLGTSLLFVAVSRMLLADPPLTLLMAGAFLSFWESLIGNRRWRLVTAVCLGLGVLAKGPYLVAVFAALAGVTYFREPSLRPSFRGYWPSGALLFSLVVAAWYFPVYLSQGGALVGEFILDQNVGRLMGTDEAHRTDGIQQLLFFPVVILVGAAPWSFHLFRAWPRGPRRSAGGPAILPQEAAFCRYIAHAFLILLILFTLSSSQLPHYIVPAVPFLAILVGIRMSLDGPVESSKLRRWGTGALSVGLLVLVNSLTIFYYHYSGQAEAHRFAEFVRNRPEPVVNFQLPRRNDLPPADLRVNETSLPSFAFYARKDVRGVESLLRPALRSEPLLVFTRAGRITDKVKDQVERQGARLVRVDVGFPTRFFELHRLEPEGPR